MGIKQVKILVADLGLDMYISGLDRPWTQTPFPLQGFYLRNEDEIKKLQLVCKYVYIDVSRGSGPLSENVSLKPKKKISSLGEKAALVERNTGEIKVAPLVLKKDVYQDVSPLKKELKAAEGLLDSVSYAVSEVMAQIERGAPVEYREIKQAASGMVDSVIRNPDALTWLARVQEKDEYTHDHAIRCTVWALLFARHAGLRKADMEVLAEGVLMKDVGKVRLPQDVLISDKRSREQQVEFEQFVKYGVDILRNSGGVSPKVISVVKNHCERLDGSGFPARLRGDKIPLPAKVAGIVSVYDEITNPRYSKYPLSPSKAVSELYKMRGNEFQEQLVVEFIQAIGLYPTGTVVELTSGEVGVVVEQNFGRRLKPKVAIVRNAAGDDLRKPVMLDMLEVDKKRQELIKQGKYDKANDLAVDVSRDLEAGSLNIDVNEILKLYLGAQKNNILKLFSRN